MASKPVVRLLAHTSSPITALAVSPDGKYMATAGKDNHFKVWDVRMYKTLHDYFSPATVDAMDFSGTGLLSLGMGSEVQVWKNSYKEKQKAPYMKHRLSRQ